MKVTASGGSLPLDLIAGWVGGEVIVHLMKETPAVQAVCTDSREAGPGTLMCAIRGERTDGHKYMETALEAGCRTFLCEQIPETLAVSDTPWAAVRVPDTVAALSPMAAGFRRDRLPHLLVVGVTGSVGKTTVKELCAAVLGRQLRTHRREGNFNSIIGLPLSVLEIDTACQAAVLEMGMSARGEIAALSRAVCPDVGIITNIGSSHLEHLGSREKIAWAKQEIIEGMRPGGSLLIPADEPLLSHLPDQGTDGRDISVYRVSANGSPASFAAERVHPEGNGMTFDLTWPDGAIWPKLRVPAMGRHMVYGATLAAAVGYLCGMSRENVAAGLVSYRPAAMRQTVHRIKGPHGGLTLLEDCYNAAPESMQAALEVLDLTASREQGRRLAVLGDMRELGERSVMLHREVGEACAHRGLDALVTVGALGAEIGRGAVASGMDPARVHILSADGTDFDPRTIANLIWELACGGDTVLLKASRAVRLERVCEVLEESAED